MAVDPVLVGARGAVPAGDAAKRAAAATAGGSGGGGGGGGMVVERAPSGPRGDARGAREPAAGLKATSVRGALARGGVLRVPAAPFPNASMDGGAALAPPPQARRPPPHPGLGGGVPMHVDVDAPLGSSNAGSSCRCSCRPGSSDATDCSCPCHGFPAAGIGGGGGAPMDQSANSSGGGGLLVASTSAGGGAVGRRSTAAAAAQAAARATVVLGRLAADSKRAEDAASARERLEALAASSVRPGTNISSGGVLPAKRFRGSSAPSSVAPSPVRAPILTGSSAPSLDSSMVNPQQGASPPIPAAASGGPPLAGFKRAGRGPTRASATKKQQGVEDPFTREKEPVIIIPTSIYLQSFIISNNVTPLEVALSAPPPPSPPPYFTCPST